MFVGDGEEEILFHELVHAIDQSWTTRTGSRYGLLAKMDDTEEFLAVLTLVP